jgi:hypothetical protein
MAIHIEAASRGKDDAASDLHAGPKGYIAGAASRLDENAPTAIESGAGDRRAGKGGDTDQCQNTDAEKMAGHTCLLFHPRCTPELTMPMLIDREDEGPLTELTPIPLARTSPSAPVRILLVLEVKRPCR